MPDPKYTRKWGLSPSMIQKFEQCPARFEGVNILKKVPYVETEASIFGDVVHKALENYVKTSEVLPSYLHHLVPVIDGLRARGYKLFAELQLAVNRNWERCGWWDQDCLTRGKIDFLAVNFDARHALQIDWKSGKRSKDDSQLNLYGLMVLAHLEGLDEIESWFFWIQHRKTDKVIVNGENAAELREDFNKRIAVIDDAYHTGNFPTRPSPLCAWCPFLETCEGGAAYRGKAKFLKGKK